MPNSRPRRAALYVRVSSDRQTVENQRPELSQLAAQRGLEVVRVYEEVKSATKVRPEFDRMMGDAHAGRFDVLLVWACDRLGRSMVGNMQTILELDRLGVRVISARESWLDMSGPVRSLLIGIFGWCAEQELERLRSRCRAGIERARRQGKHIGRPRAHVDVERALLLRAQGKSVREVAALMGLGTGTVHRALQAARVPEPPVSAAS